MGVASPAAGAGAEIWRCDWSQLVHCTLLARCRYLCRLGGPAFHHRLQRFGLLLAVGRFSGKLGSIRTVAPASELLELRGSCTASLDPTFDVWTFAGVLATGAFRYAALQRHCVQRRAPETATTKPRSRNRRSPCHPPGQLPQNHPGGKRNRKAFHRDHLLWSNCGERGKRTGRWEIHFAAGNLTYSPVGQSQSSASTPSLCHLICIRERGQPDSSDRSKQTKI